MNLKRNNDLLEAASLAINNTQNNTLVQQQLQKFGLTAARLQTGQNLLKRLEQKHLTQTKVQHERWALSQQINASLLAARDQFKEHARLAQIAFREDSPLLNLLGVSRIASRRWECVRQAVFFYDRLSEQPVSLEGFGVSAQELTQAQDTVTQLLQLKEVRVLKTQEAEQRTQEKKEVQGKLYDWLIEFRAIARQAFQHQPQILDMFGMRVIASVS